MEEEAVPTLVVPPGFDLDAYIDELFVRFGNPHVQDVLERLSVDASNRVPKFLVPVLVDRVAADASSDVGASVLACWRAWCREAGRGRFAIDDVRAAALVAAAAPGPVACLHAIPLPSELLEAPGFGRAYGRAADGLEPEGPGALPHAAAGRGRGARGR